MRAALLVSFALGLVACGDGSTPTPAMTVDAAVDPPDGPPAPDLGAPDAAVDPVPDAAVDPGPDASPPPDPLGPAHCDPLVPQACMLPWPSNRFLVPDESTATGFRLAPDQRALPVSSTGIPIATELTARLDGFGPGTPIFTLIPHLDADGLPAEDSIERSIDPETNAALFEVTAAGLVAVPMFVELDRRVDAPAERVLFLRPAVLLKADARYVVAFRRLVDLDGQPITPTAAFTALRDGAAERADLMARQAEFDAMFTALDDVGWARETLTQAWPFRTASAEALHGDVLHMRDEAFDRVGPEGPELTIDRIDETTREQDGEIALRIFGTMRVPHYMREVPGIGGATAWEFDRDGDGRPRAEGWRDAPFFAMVPHQALDGPPQGLVMHGHGLNGSFGQTDSAHFRRTAEEHGYIYFGIDLVGMSRVDVPNILGVCSDANRFVWMVDRLHQGMLESVLVARAMRHRLGALPEMVERGITVDGDRLFYEGNSQGGIYGATIMALAPDLTRGVLGVPGQNYALLFERSVDFDPFLLLLRTTYPDRIERLMVIALIQSLWDTIDPSTHYRHLIAEPHPGCEAAQVILGTARADHQVAVLTAEIVARSDIGIGVMGPYDDERTPALVDLLDYPHAGSALINWVYENPWPPIGNQPPRDGLPDPHHRPRQDPDYRRQLAHFFATGEIIDVCGGGICPPR